MYDMKKMIKYAFFHYNIRDSKSVWYFDCFYLGISSNNCFDRRDGSVTFLPL